MRTIKSREELRELVRDRRDELDVSHLTIDSLAGIADGHTSKLVCEPPIRNFGPTSLAAILGALALGIVEVTIVEDPEQAAKVSGRWTRRKRRRVKKAAGPEAVLCVVTNGGEAQPSFEFVHREKERSPNVEQPNDDHDHHAD
jgi:hypothetical protein